VREPVLIKSSRYGIVLYLDSDMPYLNLLSAVKGKFEASAHFFAHADMTVEFVGRTFTKEEEIQVIETIEEAAKVHILCIIDKDSSTEKLHKRVLDESRKELHAKDGMFYKGTLRGRQILESESSIVIIGDVEEGATVVSKGNVVVTGTVYGTIIAGAGGNYEAVIAALHISQGRLKIGDIRLKPVIGGSYSWARLL
jgi:septum site-determining protein MinC